MVLYDPQTRSELQTSQPFPNKNNKCDQLTVNADGSVDIYFGPPTGKEAQLDSIGAQQGLVRDLPSLPLEPWFDKTWRPGEIEPVQ